MSEQKELKELREAIQAKAVAEVERICKNLGGQTPKIQISEDLIIFAMDVFSHDTSDAKLVLRYIAGAGAEISEKSLLNVIHNRDLAYLPVLCDALKERDKKIPEEVLISAIQKYAGTGKLNKAVSDLIPVTANVSEKTLDACLLKIQNSVEGVETLENILKAMRDNDTPLSIIPLKNHIASLSRKYPIRLCKELITRKLALDDLGQLLSKRINTLPEGSQLTWELVDAAINTATEAATYLPEGLLLSFLESDNKTKIESTKRADGRLDYINQLLNITIKSNGSFSVNAIEKIIATFPEKPPEGFINAVIDSASKTSKNFPELLEKIVATKNEAYVLAFCNGLTEKKINLQGQDLITDSAMTALVKLPEKTVEKALEAAVRTGSHLSSNLLGAAIDLKSHTCIDIICHKLIEQKERLVIPEHWFHLAMGIPKGEAGIEAYELLIQAVQQTGGEVSEKVQAAVEAKKNPPPLPTNTASPGTPPQSETDTISTQIADARNEIFSPPQNVNTGNPPSNKVEPQREEPSSGTMLDTLKATLKAHKAWAAGNGVLIVGIIVLLILTFVIPPVGAALALGGGLSALAMAGIIGAGALLLWNALCAIGNLIQNAFSKTPSHADGEGPSDQEDNGPDRTPLVAEQSPNSKKQTVDPTSTVSTAPEVTAENTEGTKNNPQGPSGPGSGPQGQMKF